MLLPAVAILAILLIVFWRWGGSVRALLIAWLVCLLPTAFGIIHYDYLVFAGDFYIWVILSSIGSYLLGAALVNVFRSKTVEPLDLPLIERNFAAWRSPARLCLVIAFSSILFTLINIFTGNLALSDLAAIRSEVIEQTGANIWARLSAVTTWACFFCLAFGIYHRSQMKTSEALLYFLAGTGVFISMLALAGRNSVLQLIIFALVIEGIRKAQLKSLLGKVSGLSSRVAISGAGVAYLLYITLNRPGNLDIDQRSAYLFRIFNAHLDPAVDAALDWVAWLKGPIVEFLLYISHTAPLFSINLDIDYGGLFGGVFTFPFIARQLEAFHGISVSDALDLKRNYVESAGVIGFGWTTGLSSYIMDFGYVGSYLVMFLQGAAAQGLYWKVRRGGGIGSITLYVAFVVAAALLPFIAAFADTNILLLMIFTWLLSRFVASRRHANYDEQAAARLGLS